MSPNVPPGVTDAAWIVVPQSPRPAAAGMEADVTVRQAKPAMIEPGVVVQRGSESRPLQSLDNHSRNVFDINLQLR